MTHTINLKDIATMNGHSNAATLASLMEAGLIAFDTTNTELKQTPKNPDVPRSNKPIKLEKKDFAYPCILCKKPMVIGETIVRGDSGNFAHVTCADEFEAQTPRNKKPATKEAPSIGDTRVALFTSKCPACKKQIVGKKDNVSFNGEKWVHEACLVENDLADAPKENAPDTDVDDAVKGKSKDINLAEIANAGPDYKTTKVPAKGRKTLCTACTKAWVPGDIIANGMHETCYLDSLN